ncbi:MAG: hypothetical protein BMS9Abin05_0554 [Rhodothermia bacterium]|nr:MAG: hypothetical protein BMS9Abin05_0554 [Rhodothermia bacterium]
MNSQRGITHTFWIIILSLVPLVFLAFVLASGMPVNPWFFLFFLLIYFFGIFYVLGSHGSHEKSGESTPEQLSVKRVPENLILKTVDVMVPLADYKVKNNYVIEGPLLLKSDAALEELQQRFAGTFFKPLLKESDAGRPMLVLVPADALPISKQKTGRPWINLVLFLATFLTTTWAGAAYKGINLLEQPSQFTAGLPYAAALMFILAAHELGHYFTARRYGMSVTLPYFIPLPFMLGTFGAFIRMKSLAPDRRAMFDVAVAGPLAGLAIAIPALLVGLQYSTIVPDTETPALFMGGTDVGSSVLFAFLAKVALGETVLEGHRLILHPVAFAGWLGLLVTALNLVPVGQLDGGHLVHTLLGHKNAGVVSVVSLLALVVLGLFVWSGLLFWALLIFFVAGTSDIPPLNDVTPLLRGRLVLGAVTFSLLLFILVPVPHALYASFGIHYPYV